MTKAQAIDILDRAQASMRDFVERNITSQEHEAERTRLANLIATGTPLYT